MKTMIHLAAAASAALTGLATATPAAAQRYQRGDYYSQSYGDQGYGNQGYDSRGYDSRGYDNRGGYYERR
ncbi:MAG: hypothetical protein H0X36_10760, partial [Sphingomonadaceae bacterium]|nr:hypothetical protein [Sphingomonadaceae bacterium]